MKYIGVDFGTYMVKAAEVDSLANSPALVRLAASDPFYPCSVTIDEQGKAIAGGWDAHDVRFADRSVISGFRDTVGDPDHQLSPSAISLDRLEILGQFLYACHWQLTNAVDNILGIAITVPDHWENPNWFYAVAQGRAGWRPHLIVREWQAVGAVQEDLTCENVVFTSVGASGTCMTLCRLQQDCWQKTASVRTDRVSGTSLRSALVNLIAEETIDRIRIDPREDGQADVALRKAVDELFVQIAHNGRGAVSLSVLGREIHRTMDTAELACLADDHQRLLRKQLSSLLKEYEIDAADLVFWGELALLLPLREWFTPLCPSGTQPIVCSLDCAALGAARLCAASAQMSFLGEAGLTGGVSVEDGKYVSEMAPDDHSEEVIPVLRGLPGRLVISDEVRNGQLCWVEPAGEEGRSTALVRRQLLLGRTPRAGLALGSEEFPEVSFEHCVVIKRGGEFIIRDLDSTNGTYVNGERVSIHTLDDRDEVQLGNNGPKFRFEFVH